MPTQVRKTSVYHSTADTRFFNESNVRHGIRVDTRQSGHLSFGSGFSLHRAQGKAVGRQVFNKGFRGKRFGIKPLRSRGLRVWNEANNPGKLMGVGTRFLSENATDDSTEALGRTIEAETGRASIAGVRKVGGSKVGKVSGYVVKQSRNRAERLTVHAGKQGASLAMRSAALAARSAARVIQAVAAVLSATVSIISSLPIVLAVLAIVVVVVAIISFIFPSAGAVSAASSLCGGDETQISAASFPDGTTGANISDSVPAGGSSVFDGHFQPPLKGALTVSSGFNPYRRNPVDGVVRSHDGVDLPAPGGTPIYAAGPGKVVNAGDGGTCGNWVRIQHPSVGGTSYLTQYCHMSVVEAYVGQQVLAGQEIGKVGSTGRSTGNHLHFGLKVNGKYVNPYPVIANGTIPTTYAAAIGSEACAGAYGGLSPSNGKAMSKKFPPESMTVPDKRISGAKITPRLAKLRDALMAQPNLIGKARNDFQCWDAHPQNPSSDHSRGRACDLPFVWYEQATGKDLADGNNIARWLIAHQEEYGVKYVIWQAQIYYSSTGKWQPYSNSGSVIDGHRDHVHVSVY